MLTTTEEAHFIVETTSGRNSSVGTYESTFITVIPIQSRSWEVARRESSKNATLGTNYVSDTSANHFRALIS